jgi:hypothetical protein
MRSAVSISWLPLGLLVVGVFGTACGSSALPRNRGTGGSNGGGPGSGGAWASGGSPGVAGHNGSGGGSGGAPVGGSGGSGSGGRGTTGSGGSAGADGGGCICPAIYAPVCGANGVTYSNSCDAQCVGASIAHQGACTDGGVDASGGRGVCNHDSDCMFRPTDSCCGSCLAVGDVPAPPTSVCGGGACVIQPGGCSCVNHQCMRGVLTQGAACDLQQDACGNGLKCCRPCAVPPPVDGGADTCNPPVCTTVQFVGGAFSCPLIP